VSIFDGIPRKPRTTVKRFAAELKVRISKAVEAFDSPEEARAFVAGLDYVKGAIDTLLADYDVRDPEDWERMARGRTGDARDTRNVRKKGP